MFRSKVPAWLLLCAACGVSAETITVSAAVSLGPAFQEITAQFVADYPGDTVLLNLGGSGALLQQILKGAPVHVFASADEYTMDKAAQAGVLLGHSRRTFARNTLVLIQPQGRTPISSLADLTTTSIHRIAIGNPETVPAGRYARLALDASGHWQSVQDKLIIGQNVRQVLDYVARGEVDAGLVYGTDARLAQDKVAVALDNVLPTAVTAPVAVLKYGEHSAAAQRFVDLLLSPQGQAVLQSHGFQAVR